MAVVVVEIAIVTFVEAFALVLAPLGIKVVSLTILGGKSINKGFIFLGEKIDVGTVVSEFISLISLIVFPVTCGVSEVIGVVVVVVEVDVEIKFVVDVMVLVISCLTL